MNRIQPPRFETFSRATAPALTALFMAHGLSASAPTAAAPAISEPGQSAEPGSVESLQAVEVQGQRMRAVSSPKFTAPLVDTPQTISVIPQTVFSQQGAA